jgi:protoheme IX farnesyltransferase
VLTKPRVVQLIVFCALIGMLLAQPGLPDWQLALAGTLGIWLVASAAAAFNCLVEQQIDRRMARTAWRPSAKGTLTSTQTLVFSAVLCAIGSAVLYWWVNPLTMWLTFATFVGYAVIYTVVLKPLTPQNIVIGGASGAMPPVLGWAAMTWRRGSRGADPVPDHLPVDAAALLGPGAVPGRGLPQGRPAHAAHHPRGEFTRLQVLLYTLVLFAATLLPFVFR